MLPLDRLDFLKAVAFVKPAIVKNDDTAMNFLHIKVQNDNAYWQQVVQR